MGCCKTVLWICVETIWTVLFFSKMHAFGNRSIFGSLSESTSLQNPWIIFFLLYFFLHSLWILFAFLTSVLRKKMEMRSGCLWLKRWWRFFISVGENNMFYINNEFALKWVSKKKWPHLTKFSKNTPFGRHYKTRALTWSHLPRGLIVNISLFSYNAVQPSTSIMKQKVQSSSVC